MLHYLLGLLKFLFNPTVSLFVKVDDSSRIDRKARVYGFTQFYRSSIGRYSYIGRNSKVVCADIGSFCSIGEGVNVGLATHTLEKLSTSPLFTESKNGTGHAWVKQSTSNPYKRVTIGNDVWIGTRAMILGGCTVGDGAVVAAGAIVTKDVPPYSIVAGVPAKVIRYRFQPELIDGLEELHWWTRSDDELKASLDLFQSDDIDVESLKHRMG